MRSTPSATFVFLTLATLISFLTVAALVFGLAPPLDAQAAGILYVDADATGDNDGTSWPDAYTDLQSALATADSGDEIWVAEGSYTPTGGADRTLSFQLKSGVALYGGFSGTETSRDQRDWMNQVTVLSGDIGAVGDASDNSYHVITGSGTDASAVLDGFTVSGGNANDGNWPNGVGGGMYNVGGSPTLVNITFRSNYAISGGGMQNQDHSSPTLFNVTFYDNSGYEGGGIHNYSYSNPTLTNVTFIDNSADDYAGGGMANVWHSSPILVNVMFRGNSADQGGGMANYSNSSPVLVNITFYDNSADYGGGIANTGSLTLTNCILWDNTATSTGAQIYNSSGTALIRYSLVAGSGGSGAGWDSSLGTDGGGNLDTDPQFIDAALGNLRLQLTSPAIDAGDNSALPADSTDLDGDGDTAEPIPFDLGSNPRRVDIPDVPDIGVGLPPIVDLGAYEAQGETQEECPVYLPLILRKQ